MPDELKDAATRPQRETTAPRTGLTNIFVFLVVVLILGALYLVFDAVREAKVEQEAAKERGFQSRAAVCAIQRDLGIELPPPCRVPGVLKYYDPSKPVRSSASRTAVQNLGLLCAVARKDNLSSEVLREYCGTG
jgi:hypothetical protein